MNLTLNAVYLDESQLEYIITLSTYITQENYNFNFEYFDSQNSFCTLHGVKTFPSFYLMKGDRVAALIEGKLEYKELKKRLESIPYVRFNVTV